MKRITFVISSLGSGGAERVMTVLSNEMIKTGMDVTIVMVNNNNLYYELSEKVNLVCLGCAKDKSCSAIRRTVRRISKIRKAICASRPDAVISFMAETNIDVCMAMLGKKIPLIVSERNDPKVDPAGTVKQYMRRVLYAKPKGFVFQTEDARGYFSKKIRKRSQIILNPLSDKVCEPYTGERTKRIVSVGRLNSQKNYPMLFEAYGRLHDKYPEYELEIYGEGVLEEKLKADAAKISGKITFMGFCRDVHSRIADAALYVMSSDFEGMPNALMEALSIGLPCISTDCPCGGPKMLIEPGVNGILVPVRDVSALEREMDFMLSSPEKAKEMGENAVKIRDRLSSEGITRQWLSFIETVVKS